jgi:hypothetical protein
LQFFPVTIADGIVRQLTVGENARISAFAPGVMSRKCERSAPISKRIISEVLNYRAAVSKSVRFFSGSGELEDFSEREIQNATGLDRKTIRLIQRKKEAVKGSTLRKITNFLENKSSKNEIQDAQPISRELVENGAIVYSESDKPGEGSKGGSSASVSSVATRSTAPPEEESQITYSTTTAALVPTAGDTFMVQSVRTARFRKTISTN